MSELSTRLRLRRKELGLSQEELAQRMGYRSKSSITKLEKGVNDLPQAKLEELARRAGDHSRLPAGAGCPLSAAGF
ncbi:MAG: helix-turn-helix domain-containing protein [Faecalibacterium sp.]